MKKISYLSSFVDKDVVLDYFSKVKTNERKINLDFKSRERDVNYTLKNLSSLKKEDFIINDTGLDEDEEDIFTKENELRNISNFLQDFIISEKINEKITLNKEKNILRKSKFDSPKVNLDESISKKKKTVTISNIHNLPQITLHKQSSYSPKCFEKNMSNKSINNSNNSFVKSKPPLKFFSHNTRLFKSLNENIDIEKNDVKIRKWEETILNPLNRQFDEKSEGMQKLNRIRSYSNIKKTKKSIKELKLFSAEKQESADDVKQILLKIHLMSKSKLNNNPGINQHLLNLINKQKNMSN